jgi:hypothetical protein
MGHAQALHEGLDRLAREHAEHEAQVALLRLLVERFAFEELVRRLQAVAERDDAEAA